MSCAPTSLMLQNMPPIRKATEYFRNSSHGLHDLEWPVALAPFDNIAGEDAKFLSECLCKMAEVGETNLASGLFDAHLAIDQ